MLRTIKKVEYLEGYKLRLEFDNKRAKVVDLEQMAKSSKNMFLRLRDVDYFKRVKCDGITIIWPNGVDLCPDVLYKMGKDVSQRLQKSRKATRTTSSRKRSKAFHYSLSKSNT